MDHCCCISNWSIGDNDDDGGGGYDDDVTSAPSLAVFRRRLKTTFSPLLQCCLTV